MLLRSQKSNEPWVDNLPFKEGNMRGVCRTMPFLRSLRLPTHFIVIFKKSILAGK